jgi:hypothetical protein
MLRSINVQSFNSKFFIFEATQKCQNMTDFDVLKVYTVHYYVCQILLFLHRQYYKVFRVKILHVYRS